MSSLLSLFSPDLMTLLVGIASGIFGYWIKKHPGIVVPEELTNIVQLLIQRHEASKQAEAHNTLQELAQHILLPGTSTAAPVKDKA